MIVTVGGNKVLRVSGSSEISSLDQSDNIGNMSFASYHH